MRLKKTEEGRGRVGIVILVIVIILVILAAIHPHVTGDYLQRLWHDIVDMIKATIAFLKAIFRFTH